MHHHTRFVGLDVHKDDVAVALAEGSGGAAKSLGRIPNSPQAVRKLVRRLGPPQRQSFCYEAGPCGYGLYRQLKGLGAQVIVVAPGLVPTRPSDRVKTDRRDARRLAGLLRSGELQPVWVPDTDHEALRDLTRARDDARRDLLRKPPPAGEVPAATGPSTARGGALLDPQASGLDGQPLPGAP